MDLKRESCRRRCALIGQAHDAVDDDLTSSRLVDAMVAHLDRSLSPEDINHLWGSSQKMVRYVEAYVEEMVEG